MEKGGGKGQHVRQVEGADECGLSETGSSSSTSYRSSGDGGSTASSGAKPSAKLLTLDPTILEEDEYYEFDLTYVGDAGEAICTCNYLIEKVLKTRILQVHKTDYTQTRHQQNSQLFFFVVVASC